MATLDLRNQMHPKTIDVGHGDHAQRGRYGRALGNPKDSTWVAPFHTKAGWPTRQPTSQNPAQALRATVPAAQLLPFVGRANVMPDVFPAKFDIAPAHSVDVEMNASPDSDDDMVDADPDALDDVEMPHNTMSDVPTGPAQREPLHDPAHAADVEMTDRDQDDPDATLVECDPFEPVTWYKRIRSHDEQDEHPSKRCKVTRPAHRRSPWSSSLITTSGKERRRALRDIKRTSPPIIITAKPSTTGLYTPPAAASNVSAPTPAALFDSFTATPMEFDTPNSNIALESTSGKHDDIVMDDAAEDMLIDMADFAMSSTSKEMDIDRIENDKTVMGDVPDDMDMDLFEDDDIDIDIDEDTDIVMHQIADEMEIDTYDDDMDIFMGNAPEDMHMD